MAKLSPQQIQERLDREGRGIVLDQSTYVSCKTKARFIDPEYGEWWATPNNVLYNKRNHPQRSLKNRVEKFNQTPRRMTAEKIRQTLRSQGRDYIDIDDTTFAKMSEKARFIDRDFGEWWATPNNVLRWRNHPCRIVNKNNLEKFIEKELGLVWSGGILMKDGKYKPDFKLNDRVYLNVDGLYWHSEECRKPFYHFEMRKWFEERGMRILQFRENEIKKKWEIVKSIIDAVVGRFENKVGARKCEIVKMNAEECYEFYEKWHLKGGVKVGGYGLKYGDEIVAAISTKNFSGIVKVERFCIKAGWSVSGGYSRLLNRALEDYDGVVKVQSWVDLRYGDGHSLERMGFVRVKDTLGWEWTDFVDTYNRLKCRANMDERGLSEKEHAEELGWIRIYDAGQRLFEKVINENVNFESGLGHNSLSELNELSEDFCLVKNQQKDVLMIEQIQAQLDLKQNGVVLDKSTFIDYKTKARFIDPEFGEWWDIPRNVLKGKTHPKRSLLKRTQKRTISPQQIQERLDAQGRNIVLDVSTYTNTHTKARFIDPEYGEWWARPSKVLHANASHPARARHRVKIAKTLSAEQVQDMLSLDGRGIKLDKSTYVRAAVKARFIDPEFGEWWDVPFHVVRGRNHPKRRKSKRND